MVRTAGPTSITRHHHTSNPAEFNSYSSLRGSAQNHLSGWETTPAYFQVIPSSCLYNVSSPAIIWAPEAENMFQGTFPPCKYKLLQSLTQSYKPPEPRLFIPTRETIVTFFCPWSEPPGLSCHPPGSLLFGSHNNDLIASTASISPQHPGWCEWKEIQDVSLCALSDPCVKSCRIITLWLIQHTWTAAADLHRSVTQQIPINKPRAQQHQSFSFVFFKHADQFNWDMTVMFCSNKQDNNY